MLKTFKLLVRKIKAPRTKRTKAFSRSYYVGRNFRNRSKIEKQLKELSFNKQKVHKNEGLVFDGYNKVAGMKCRCGVTHSVDKHGKLDFQNSLALQK